MHACSMLPACCVSLTCNEAGAVGQLPLSGQVQKFHQELTVVPGVEVAAVNRQRAARQAVCGAAQEQ